MKTRDSVINWLMEGDPSIIYQTKRDLLHETTDKQRSAQLDISRNGWGKAFLAKQNSSGHWGRGAYQPKWICTHYTLLDLKTIGIDPNNPACKKAIRLLLGNKPGVDGGLNYARTVAYSDICINGMILNMASYFMPEAACLRQIVDYILDHQFADGGWNCLHYQGATHSSFHTTIGVLEGLDEYQKTGDGYRKTDIKEAISDGVEFMLVHKLYKSDKTGEPIDEKMLKLSFPCRWKYDILRGLELLWHADIRYDARMSDAIEQLVKKRRSDGIWPLQQKHPGQTHFNMEKTGEPSRWNTLRALRVLKHFNAI